MGLEQNKELVRRFLPEAINERDAGACERLLSPDFVRHEITLILAEDELVAAHQLWRGTHGGEFMGVAATGKKVEFSSTAILRLADGLIARPGARWTSPA